MYDSVVRPQRPLFWTYLTISRITYGPKVVTSPPLIHTKDLGIYGRMELRTALTIGRIMIICLWRLNQVKLIFLISSYIFYTSLSVQSVFSVPPYVIWVKCYICPQLLFNLYDSGHAFPVNISGRLVTKSISINFYFSKIPLQVSLFSILIIKFTYLSFHTLFLCLYTS